ncbi:capsule assembly Wzi family protein [Geomonas sp.]|uniref:capsule assembly Wzi family protein n=1 Tax=Geomonas sp. TaxID=2651584 RepID=UPI002B470358|nr:capsule assembly Wzi family protein [Geomonas sp.]HJV36780.1 capsule assembly Wzi family protein [Geomonas sp.]
MCYVYYCFFLLAEPAFALSSVNIPLDSPIYLYLDKLAGFGLITSDIKGIRPYSKSEAARLLLEAERRLDSGSYPPLATEFAARLRELIPREASLYDNPSAAPAFDFTPVANARLRYFYLDGAPRNYQRVLNDPGNDGVFGIGHGLRPPNPYPTVAQQRGSEGTPLMENNEGVIYHSGNNVDLRLSGEAYAGCWSAFLVEPMFLWSAATDDADLRVDKVYLKLGGGGLELEVGRDENWFGLGYRGAITLSNNARNFDFIKLSSPEPVLTRYLWDLKYSLIFSRFEESVTDGKVRQPYFLAAKVSFKPTQNSEFGINLGRQVGGPGVDNGTIQVMRGLVGGFNNDDSNTLAGFELRIRLPFLRNTEIFGEYSGEDAASFWPIVESYLAGFYIPNLTESGSDDLRFEYFFGNNILYTHYQYVEGYNREGLPIGHSQGGGTEDFFLRYSHWFSPRNNLALEWFHTSRGTHGRLPVDAAGNFDPFGVMQAVERKNALRAMWTLPVYGQWNALLSYGIEWVDNYNLQPGVDRTNQVARVELTYRY